MKLKEFVAKKIGCMQLDISQKKHLKKYYKEIQNHLHSLYIYAEIDNEISSK